MSTETLARPVEIEDTRIDISPATLTNIGMTAFEALAIDAKEAEDKPDTEISTAFTSSVTRLGDGQTVPDER